MSRICGFILAAGEGRRLRPATLTRPKALVPFCGVPLLELVASSLAEQGISPIVVNACYQADRIYEACARLQMANGWDLRVSLEPQLLNQGGGLRKGVELVPEAEHVLVHNVDIVLDYDLKKLVRLHLERNAAATVLLIPNRGPKTVSLDEKGNIRNFRDRENGTYTFSGIHILRRDVLKYLDDTAAPDIIKAYQQAMVAGETVQAVVAEENVYWSDIGTPLEYIRAHGQIVDCPLSHHSALRKAQAEQARRRFALELKGVTCTGALGLGTELGVPAGSHLHNAVLWDYTRLPKALLYADGIFVGDDVQSPKVVDDKRVPDARIYLSLGVEPSQCTLEELAKQGSGRKYCRLRHGDRNWVWSAYNPERRENAGFAAISDFLYRLGIHVPRVVLHLADTFELVSEDLGQSDLQLASDVMREGFLFQVVEQLARLHVLGDQAVRLEELPLQRGFTKGLYDWERDYFRHNMLDVCLEAPELWGPVAAEYCQLRSLLLKQPLVPIHRDMQSANVKVLDGKVYLIDFQGMRLGCAAYDLGSLLYDPYQCYPMPLRQKVWSEYCRRVRDFGGVPPEDDILQIAACQRLMQALGAYGKLWRQDRLEWYRQFIVPGFRMLVAAASETTRFPALRAMAEKGLELAMNKLGCN